MRSFVAIALLCFALAACRDPTAVGAGSDSARDWRDATAFFERRWQASLPCADCAGIELALVLRQDFERREYVLLEAYLAGSGRDYEVFERSGEWTVRRDGEAIVYVLDPGDALAARGLRLRRDGGLESWPPSASAADWRMHPVRLD